MRQGQQNRRGRGRSNRKGQSPLTRSFESTGPDVKIRGTPSHIAEKYMSLARDATSSGDPVLAENYLQHAEHYNRIIMAVRDQQISQGGEMNGGMPRHRPFNDIEGDDFGDDEGDDDMQPMHHQSQPQMRHSEQPRMEGQRFEGGQRNFRDRHEHRGNRNNHDRGERHDRGEQRYDRGDRDRDRGEHSPQPQRARNVEPSEGTGQQPSPEGQQFQPPSPPRRERDRGERFSQQPHEQPEFLRRPVRRPRRESSNGTAPEANVAAPTDESDRD